MAKGQEYFPVYLFTGFLDSGKTKFIQETLEDVRFCTGERTLLIVCEEGEEEYTPDTFAGNNVFIKVLEEPEELSRENLASWLQEYKVSRILIEYNGMWMLDDLYSAMPENWVVSQEFFFADARTFISYNSNMRQLVYDKLKSCELAVFNRFSPDMDMMELHRIVRGISRRCDIAYETADGKVKYDDIEDPLPFDMNADIIEIEDEDFAVWYRDVSEDTAKYDGKTVKFRGLCLQRKKLPGGAVVIGRHVMTCCVEDITFAGFLLQMGDAPWPEDNSWITVTAKIAFKFSRAYGRKGPVLTAIDYVPAGAPDEPVATFY